MPHYYLIEENRFQFLHSSHVFFECLKYLGQYLSGMSAFVKRGHICNRTQNMILNCWWSPWQNRGQSKLMCFPNSVWSLLKGEEGPRSIQKKVDWMQLPCLGEEGVSIVAWIQATQVPQMDRVATCPVFLLWKCRWVSTLDS